MKECCIHVQSKQSVVDFAYTSVNANSVVMHVQQLSSLVLPTEWWPFCLLVQFWTLCTDPGTPVVGEPA